MRFKMMCGRASCHSQALVFDSSVRRKHPLYAYGVRTVEHTSAWEWASCVSILPDVTTFPVHFYETTTKVREACVCEWSPDVRTDG